MGVWEFFQTYISFNMDQRIYFVTSLFFAEAVFLFSERKNLRGKVFIFAIILYFLVGFLFPEFILPVGSYVSLLVFVISVLLAFWSLKTSFSKLVFSCIGAYAVQNLSANVSQIFEIICGANRAWQFAVLSLVCTVLIVPLSYIFLGSKFKETEIISKQKIRLMLLSFCVILIANLAMWSFRRQGLSENLNVRLLVTMSIGLVLLLQYSSYENSRLMVEKDAVEKLLLAEQQQYRISRESVDLVNRKCHDLKNQILLLKNCSPNGLQSSEVFQEAEEIINLYDSVSKTGNEALDGILTEKGLRCQKNGIVFSSIADGALLAFMKAVDLYSLFGNALDNAIESSMKEEPENRQISLKVCAVSAFVLIHVDNYCSTTPSFRDGLPVTDKQDRENHGFGVRSIVYLAEKYGGRATFSHQNNLFEVNILIPKSVQKTCSDADESRG